MSGTLIFCAVINLLYVVIEAVVGFLFGSAGLISDAGHNLSDVLTLILSLVAISIAATHPKRASWLSITNAVLLLIAVAVILFEGITKLISPEPIQGGVISITAGIGIIVNGLTAWILMKGRNEDTNIKASFLHMLSDTLVSVGVVISGIIISKTGFVLIDPIISLAIGAIILVLAIQLLHECIEEKKNLTQA